MLSQKAYEHMIFDYQPFEIRPHSSRVNWKKSFFLPGSSSDGDHSIPMDET